MATQRILNDQQRTDLVSFQIKVNNEAVGRILPIMYMAIYKGVNKVPSAKIQIRDGSAPDQDFSWSNDQMFVPGNEIEILAGYHMEEQTVFKGLIIKHMVKIREGQPALLEIECKDAAVKMTVGRKNKFYNDMTDAAIIEEVLAQYGIQGQVEDTDLEHKEVIQYHATDWDFVLSRADVNGKIVVIDDGNFKVAKPDLNQSPVMTLEYGSTIRESELEMDARYQFETVKAMSWNYADQEIIEEEGQPPEMNQEQGNVSSSDLAGVLGLASYDLKHSGEVVDQELRNWASAQLLHSRLSKIRGRLKIQGSTEIKPGAMLELRGLGDRFNGNAFVSEAASFFDGGRWRTNLQIGLPPDFFAKGKDVTTPAAAGLVPAISGLQIGTVTQLQDDPNGEDRILVRCPIIDRDAEGFWARLASLDAGENRGWVIRPEIGDEVIVGFINDDPRDPVVLGMLHSSAKPAPIPAKDENHIKGYTTRSEMKVEFDDENNIITIETPAGNSMVISEKDKAITLTDQNQNKMTMDPNGIKMESPKDIVMEATGNISIKATQNLSMEGLNVNGKANVQMKMEGSASAELSSSGMTTIKGSLVKIN